MLDIMRDVDIEVIHDRADITGNNNDETFLLIGVLAMMPNFNRLLRRFDIDFLELTAGEYKKTISPMGEITTKGLDKTKEDLERTHDLFKDYVHSQRDQLEMEKVATGETWFGSEAKDLGLVDEIATSDDYLMKRMDDSDLLLIKANLK